MSRKTLYLVVFLLGLIMVSLTTGRYPLGLSQLWTLLLSGDPTADGYALFFQIRLPRTLMVLVCGAALAVAGLVYQSIFRNPLVSPDVLGVSSGCSLGAIIALLMLGNQQFSLQALAFIGGILVMIFALLIANTMRYNPLLALVISGIVASSLTSSVIMMLKYTADPYQLPAIEFWLMGGFHNATWQKLYSILPIIGLCMILLLIFRWPLNVLSLGDEQAFTLGLPVAKLRIMAITCATLLVSAVVSVAGLVNWIGLLAPHIIKLYIGEDLNKSLPLSMLSGAILLLLADIFARTLLPSEIPISILTTLVGAPFLTYLLWRKGRERG